MARKTTKSAMTLSPIDVTHALAKAKPRTCGDAFGILTTLSASNAATFGAEGCRRLPRHHGDHAVGAKPRGLMTPAERKRAAVTSRPKVAKVASKVVTVGGTKFRVFADGKVEAFTSPKVTVIAEVETPRQVAAARKSSKTTRPVRRPTENAAIRRASRQPKAQVASA